MSQPDEAKGSVGVSSAGRRKDDHVEDGLSREVDPACAFQGKSPEDVGRSSDSASTGSRIISRVSVDDDKPFVASALLKTDTAGSDVSSIDPPQRIEEVDLQSLDDDAEDELRAMLARHEEEIRKLREENQSLIRQLRQKKEERKEVVAQPQEEDELEIKKVHTEEAQAKKAEMIHGKREEKMRPPRAEKKKILRRRTAVGSSLGDLLIAEVPLIAVSGSYNFIQFFRLDTREEVFSTRTPYGLDLIQSTLHGRPVLAVGDDQGRISFVDLMIDGKINDDETIDGHSFPIHELLDLPSDSFGDDLIASASRDKTVRVWKKEQKKQIVCFEGHRGSVYGLCCIPFKKWLVSGSCDYTVRILDYETQRVVPDGILRDHRDYVWVTQYHSKHQSIFSGSHDGKIKMFSLDGFRCVRTFQSQWGCYSLLLHPTNENLLFSGHSNGCVMLWDLRKEDKCVAKRRVHSDYVRRIVHVGENRFASCSRDRTVKLWTNDDLMAVGTKAEKSGLPTMWTSDSNYGLCSLLPLKDDDEFVRAQEERVQFLLSSFSDDQHILYCSSVRSSRSMSCLSSSMLRVWRWFD